MQRKSLPPHFCNLPGAAITHVHIYLGTYLKGKGKENIDAAFKEEQAHEWDPSGQVKDKGKGQKEGTVLMRWNDVSYPRKNGGRESGRARIGVEKTSKQGAEATEGL